MTIHIPAWVDGTLQPIEKLDVHRRGLRHPAISVFVVDGDRTLLQCRALGKYHTPGLWANACCTHPAWGEDPKVAATRRLEEELGIKGLPLEAQGRIEYRADVGSGLIEHEVVDLFVGYGTPEIDLNPDEVIETMWMTFDALEYDVRARPERYTPWLRIYLRDHASQIFDKSSA